MQSTRAIARPPSV